MNIILVGNDQFYKESFDSYIKDKKNISVNYFKDEDFKKKNIIKKIETLKPKFVVVFSGLSGGIFFNIKNSKKILEYNVEIYLTILSVLKHCKIKRVFFMSASCTYPKNQSILNYSDFLKPNLEKTSLAYASSKMIGSLYCYKVNYEDKKYKWTTIIPATIYGKKISKKDSQNMHVINAMISKLMYKKKVSFFGSGNVKREFIHIQDLISAIFFIDKKKIFSPIINIGVGYDIKIKKLSSLIAKLMNFKGKIVWKKNKKYEGTKRKLLNTKFLFDSGWMPMVSLTEGITKLLGKSNNE